MKTVLIDIEEYIDLLHAAQSVAYGEGDAEEYDKLGAKIRELQAIMHKD